MKSMNEFRKCANCDEVGNVSEMIKSPVGEFDDIQESDLYACESCVVHAETQEELMCRAR